VRAIYNFQLDEMAQSGKPILSPWLIKWKAEGPALPDLERIEANPTWHWKACFSKRADFSTRLFWGEPSGHSRLVRTFFGQNDQPLYQAVAPPSRA
jgi:hypothetical protein